MITINKSEIKYLLFAGLLGMFTAFMCPMKKTDGKSLEYSPPSILYRIVWPILYLLFGISWILSRRLEPSCDLYYFSTSILLSTWLILYSCLKQKYLAIYNLLIIICLLFCCTAHGNRISKILIYPLITWCLFALLMNKDIVKNDFTIDIYRTKYPDLFNKINQYSS